MEEIINNKITNIYFSIFPHSRQRFRAARQNLSSGDASDIDVSAAVKQAKIETASSLKVNLAWNCEWLAKVRYHINGLTATSDRGTVMLFAFLTSSQKFPICFLRGTPRSFIMTSAAAAKAAAVESGTVNSTARLLGKR